MVTLLLLLTLTRAGADDATATKTRASYLLGATLQLRWAAFTRRYPRVSAMDIRPCGANCYQINGEPWTLEPPSEKVGRLTDAVVLGVRRDTSRAFLLLRTREKDATYVWAALGLRDLRLKFLGYDRPGDELPGEVGGAEVATVARASRNLELLKFVTTRSAANLTVIREEIAVRLGCEPDYAAQLDRDVAELRARWPDSPVSLGRLAEVQAQNDLGRVEPACTPERARPWRARLLELRALVEYSLGELSPRELALDPSLPKL